MQMDNSKLEETKVTIFFVLLEILNSKMELVFVAGRRIVWSLARCLLFLKSCALNGSLRMV